MPPCLYRTTFYWLLWILLTHSYWLPQVPMGSSQELPDSRGWLVSQTREDTFSPIWSATCQTGCTVKKWLFKKPTLYLCKYCSSRRHFKGYDLLEYSTFWKLSIFGGSLICNKSQNAECLAEMLDKHVISCGVVVADVCSAFMLTFYIGI